MKKTPVKVIACTLVLALFLSSTAFVFATDSIVVNLVGVGDSMSQGYQFLDYKEDKNDGGNHYCGWKGSSQKNYLMGIKSAIEQTGATVEVEDLSLQGLQPDELLELLKPGSLPRDERSDGAQKHFAWWCLDEPARDGVGQKYEGYYVFEKKDCMSKYYIDAVKNADVMVFDSGMNYFGTSLTDSVWSVNEKPGDYKKILSKLNKKTVDFVDSLTTELQKYLNKYGLNVLSRYMDGLLYAYVSYIYYTTECIGAIYEINPEIKLVVVGLFNPHQELYLKAGDITVCFSDMINMTMESLNTYMTTLNPYANKYLFADLETTPMAFADELYFKPGEETDDLKVLLKKTYPSLLGNVESDYYNEFAENLIKHGEVLNMLQIMGPGITIPKFDTIEDYNKDPMASGFTVPYNTSEWIDKCKRKIYSKYKDAFTERFGEAFGIWQLYMLIDALCSMTDNFSEEWMKKAEKASSNYEIFGEVATEGGMDDLMRDLYSVFKELYSGENKSLIAYDEDKALPVYREALNHRAFKLSTFINFMNGSGVGDYDTSRPFLKPDEATDLDYLAIHWQIRFNSESARGFGVHPSPYGIQTKSYAIMKAYVENKPAKCVMVPKSTVKTIKKTVDNLKETKQSVANAIKDSIRQVLSKIFKIFK